MKRSLLFALAFLLVNGAHAAHLRNVGTGYCATIAGTQAACAASGTQDVVFEDQGGGQYRMRIGALCFAATTGAVGEAVTMATCSSATGQRWTVFRDAGTTASRHYQNALVSGTQGAGNCLGLDPASPTTAGAALALVYCIDQYREWSTDLEYVYTQAASGSTTPVYAYSGATLGSKVAGVTASVGTTCSCETFASGPYCHISSGRAALCKPTSGRSLASIKQLTFSARAASVIPNPATVAARTLTNSVRIDATNGQIIENKRIRPTDPTDVCIYIAPGVHDVIIRNNDIGECRYAVFAPGFGDNTVVTGNLIHGVASGMYGPSGPVGTFQFTNNFIYGLDDRNAAYDGAAIQVGDSQPGTMQTKINCNVIHLRYTTGLNPAYSPHTIDKVNLGGTSHGTSGQPIEIAYNRILGGKTGGDDSGSGFQLGDTPGTPIGTTAWFNVHHNNIVFANGGGITISSGDHITLDTNLVDSRGEATGTKTGVSFNWSNYYGSPSGPGCTAIGNCNGTCDSLTVTNNRGISRLWYYGSTGNTVTTANNGNCTNKTISGNNFGDTTLSGEALFETPFAACEP